MSHLVLCLSLTILCEPAPAQHEQRASLARRCNCSTSFSSHLKLQSGLLAFLLKQTKTKSMLMAKMTAATPRRSTRSCFISPPPQTQSIRGTARCLTRSGQNGCPVQSGSRHCRSSLSSQGERMGGQQDTQDSLVDALTSHAPPSQT
jgi:hypothetical protein